MPGLGILSGFSLLIVKAGTTPSIYKACLPAPLDQNGEKEKRSEPCTKGMSQTLPPWPLYKQPDVLGRTGGDGLKGGLWEDWG